jgi:hypothetical protein
MSIAALDPTIPRVLNVLIMDSEGKRIAVKYYSSEWCGFGLRSLARSEAPRPQTASRFLSLSPHPVASESRDTDAARAPSSLPASIAGSAQSARACRSRVSSRARAATPTPTSALSLPHSTAPTKPPHPPPPPRTHKQTQNRASVSAQANFEKLVWSKTARTNARGEGER